MLKVRDHIKIFGCLALKVLHTLHMRVSFNIMARNGLLLIPILNGILYHSWRALTNSQKMRGFPRGQMFQPYASYSASSPGRKVIVPHFMSMRRTTKDKQCIRILHCTVKPLSACPQFYISFHNSNPWI